MKIGTVPVGPGHPVYVVAEAGSNHNGDYQQAVRLIEAAAEADADAAKFQLFHPDRLYPGRHTPGAIDPDWLHELQHACHNNGIEFICSVFDQPTLDEYLSIDPAAVKIASPEAANQSFVLAAARVGIPLIVSTGAMTIRQVRRLPRSAIVLACTSAYPAPIEDLNLATISHYRQLFARVGLSDHSRHPWLAPVTTTALGACLIEKHLTLNRNADGPDHGFALEPDEFAQMVSAVRDTSVALGDGAKRVMPSEDATDRRAA